MNDKKKYKYTRQLLKIAKQEGKYTNKEIEKKAGLTGSSSSLASRWLNGHSLATERQMRYFINNYGHLLKRQMEHLYYQYLPDGEELVTNYVKFSGDIIFKHQIRMSISEYTGRRYRNPRYVGIFRVLIIESQGCFKLLIQYRAGLISWNRSVQGEKYAYSPQAYDVDGLINGDNEDSNWYLWKVVNCDSTDALITEFSKVTTSLLDGSNIIDWAKNNGHIRKGKSDLFKVNHIAPMEFAFYQKLMKLGLQSESLPF